MRKVHRITNLILVITIVFFGLFLIHTKSKAQKMRKEIRNIQNTTVKILKELRIMEAEWEYLSSPKYISSINRKHLGLKLPKKQDFISLEEFSNTNKYNDSAKRRSNIHN